MLFAKELQTWEQAGEKVTVWFLTTQPLSLLYLQILFYLRGPGVQAALKMGRGDGSVGKVLAAQT